MGRSKAPNFEHILVIGNGFDLALGLPTSYSDFLKSNQFAKLLEQKNHIAAHLRDKLEIQRWVDIEQEFPVLSNKNTHRTSDFFMEYKQLCGSLADYVNELDYTKLDKSSDPSQIVEGLIKDGGLCILNFNYTNTIGLLFPEHESNFEHIHVHGKAEKQQIVFGVEDKAKIDSDHVFLRKAVSPGLYTDWTVAEYMKTAEKTVNIYGHSLGQTDTNQFYSFFGPGEHGDKSIINIYYHTESSYFEKFKEIERLTSQNLQRFQTQHELNMIGPEITLS